MTVRGLPMHLAIECMVYLQNMGQVISFRPVGKGVKNVIWFFSLLIQIRLLKNISEFINEFLTGKFQTGKFDR